MTFVLDFVNEPETIQAAFEPYYNDAYLESATDPYLVVTISPPSSTKPASTPRQDIERTAERMAERGTATTRLIGCARRSRSTTSRRATSRP